MDSLVERLRQLCTCEGEYWCIRCEAADALESQRWVSVDERLPKLSEDEDDGPLYVVWHRGTQDYQFAFFDGSAGWDGPDIGWLQGVTHWVSLPPPPEIGDRE